MFEFSGLDARTALVTYFGANAANHPDLGAIISKTDWLSSVIDGMEYLYARRDALNTEGLTLLSGLARFIGTNGFYGKGERAALIEGVVARINNGGAVVADTDPEPEAAFVAVEEGETA